MRYLYLNNNLISTIPSNWLEGSSVQQTYLHDNPITTIEPGFCRGAPVTRIDMPNAQLVTLPAGVFEDCSSVDTLNLRQCARLESLQPGSLRGMYGLKNIQLDYCTRLVEFDPTVLVDTPALQQLLLGAGVLERISRPFPELPNLNSMNLFDQRLRTLPVNVFQLLPASAIVTLQGNPMPTSMAGECGVGHLEQDTKHDLVYCVGMPYYCSTDTTETGTTLLKCQDLPSGTSTLDLSNYQLQRVAADAFTGLNQQVTIDLSRNALTAVPPRSAFGVHLENHTLAADAPQLTGLDLSDNAITTVDSDAFRGVRVDGTVDLRNNGITTLQPRAFTGLVARVLDLSNNAISRLTAAPLSSLLLREQLNLASNPIALVDPDVLKIGTANIPAVTVDVAPCPAAARGLSSWGGASVCSECIAGEAGKGLWSAAAHTSCVYPSTGHYCPAGKDSPQPCARGRYNAITGVALEEGCLPCAAGSIGDIEAATSVSACTFCPVGTASAAQGASASSACQPCLPGTFAPSTGLGECLLCPAGTYNGQHGAISDQACRQCPAGTRRWGDVWPASVCRTAHTVILTGTARRLRGGTSVLSCTNCEPGWFSSLAGAVECSECPKGTYTAKAGSDKCSLCPENTYNAAVGAANASACKPCPESSPISPEGSTSPLACSAVATLACGTGQYAVSTTNGTSITTTCADCPWATLVQAALPQQRCAPGAHTRPPQVLRRASCAPRASTAPDLQAHRAKQQPVPHAQLASWDQPRAPQHVCRVPTASPPATVEPSAWRRALPVVVAPATACVRRAPRHPSAAPASPC